MSDNDEEHKKPDLKIVSITEKMKNQETEFENLDFTSRAVQAYALSRAIFSEIDDFMIQEEAVNHLRKAFLIAINPLKQVDDQFDFFEFEDEE